MADPGLIDTLVADLRPVQPGIVPRRTGLALALGTALALAIVLWLWGPRPDLSPALRQVAFWGKEGFTVALSAAGFAAMLRLARPGGTVGLPSTAVAIVVLLLAGAACWQLSVNEPTLWPQLVMGKTATVCPWLIMLLALPGFAGGFRVMRAMAPTRLRLAGAVTGLTAGALSAFAYSISCDESAMPFVLTWYGGAIAATTLAGALLGPRLLRW